jgi:hypothetical protein
MSEPTREAAGLTSPRVAAEKVLALVDGKTIEPSSGDSAAKVMWAAYLHGTRRLRAMRVTAEADAGQETMILARTLLSLLARAAYVDAPTDNDERKRRWQQFHRHSLKEELRTIRSLAAAGFDVDADTTELEAEIADLAGCGALPGDTALMRDHVGLSAFYARVYGPGSDHVHFSIRAALAELQNAQTVYLDQGDRDLADEGLLLGLLVYGELLTRSERTVRHGLTEAVAEIVSTTLRS